MTEVAIANWDSLKPGKPAYALVANVDLVIIRWPDEQKVSVLYGRCQHSSIEDNKIWVDEREIVKWKKQNPQAYNRESYQGLY